jgi:hypothetical protein
MFKKTLISLAVASSLGLTGCFDSGSTGKNANPQYKISNPAIDGKTWPIFNPVTSELPIPNDLIFDSEQGDGTFGVADSSPPVTTALNELSGASTVAPTVIRFNGQIDADTVTYGETVFLIELAYASGDPVQGLGNQEPPTVAGLATARADVETLDGTSAVRILPLEPLDPRKRYVAVVTKGVTDINGDAIISSPSYANLTDETQPLGSSSLAPVRALINNLWEATAAGFFQAASIPLTADDIAISYSFTTSNDEKVLQYIAEPAAWFEDLIETFVKVSAAEQAVAGGAGDYATVKTTVDLAYDNFPNIPIDEDGTTAREAFSSLYGPSAPCESAPLGADAFDCGAIALASNFANLGLLPTPTPLNRSAADFTLTSQGTPVGLVSAVAGKVLGQLGGGTTDVLAAQGTISLPYYLGTSGADLVTKSWNADTELAQAIAGAGLPIPQADPTVSTAVNYIFPFPKKTADVEAPVLVLYPNSTTIEGVVMYQHGITTDRSAALTFGTGLAANGYVVIAIDQPLHGVAPVTEEEKEALATTLVKAANPSLTDEQVQSLVNLILAEDLANLTSALGGDGATAQSLINTVKNGGSTIPGLAPQIGNERHFGFYATQPGVPAPIDYANGVGDSGSLYINLGNFLNTRDNGRQSAVDQMNLRASLPGLTLTLADGSTTFSIAPTDPVLFVGHSLGTITGTPFVASVNEDQLAATISGGSTVPSTFNNISAASLLTPGGGIVRLLENSPAFAPQILFGLQQAAGLEQGDANLETFLNVFQAAVDTADPINFADNLASASSPMPLALLEVPGDQVIPNAADEQVWGVPALNATFTPAQTGLPVNVTVDSFSAPLSGTQPLAFTGSAVTTVSGGTHGTPVSADNSTVFVEMLCQTFVTFGGTVPAYCAP